MGAWNSKRVWIGGLVAPVITGKNRGFQSSAVIVARHAVQQYPISKMRREPIVLRLTVTTTRRGRNTSSRSGSHPGNGEGDASGLCQQRGLTLLRSVGFAVAKEGLPLKSLNQRNCPGPCRWVIFSALCLRISFPEPWLPQSSHAIRKEPCFPATTALILVSRHQTFSLSPM